MTVKPVTTTANTITLQGAGLLLVGEDALDSACRQIAITGGFSVHESLNLVHQAFAQLEFPHPEAAAQFASETKGELQVGSRTFTVRHPMGWSRQAKEDAQAAAANSPSTNTLVVKQLHKDVVERDILTAFAKAAPRIKGVKLQKTISGQSKGFAYVEFHEVFEASNAMRHFREQGNLIDGRKVLVDFAPAQTIEEQWNQQAQKEQSEATLANSHAKALSGPNADMWATYLSMFNGSGDAQKEEEAVQDDAAAEGSSQGASNQGAIGADASENAFGIGPVQLAEPQQVWQEPDAKRLRTDGSSGQEPVGFQSFEVPPSVNDGTGPAGGMADGPNSMVPPVGAMQQGTQGGAGDDPSWGWGSTSFGGPGDSVPSFGGNCGGMSTGLMGMPTDFGPGPGTMSMPDLSMGGKGFAGRG